MKNIIILFIAFLTVVACKKEKVRSGTRIGVSANQRIKESINGNQKTTYQYSGNKLVSIQNSFYDM